MDTLVKGWNGRAVENYEENLGRGRHTAKVDKRYYLANSSKKGIETR